jgi:hypothetical protein
VTHIHLVDVADGFKHFPEDFSCLLLCELNTLTELFEKLKTTEILLDKKNVAGVFVVFYKFDNIRVIELLKRLELAQELFLMGLIHILLLYSLNCSGSARFFVDGFVDFTVASLTDLIADIIDLRDISLVYLYNDFLSINFNFIKLGPQLPYFIIISSVNLLVASLLDLLETYDACVLTSSLSCTDGCSPPNNSD